MSHDDDGNKPTRNHLQCLLRSPVWNEWTTDVQVRVQRGMMVLLQVTSEEVMKHALHVRRLPTKRRGSVLYVACSRLFPSLHVVLAHANVVHCSDVQTPLGSEMIRMLRGEIIILPNLCSSKKEIRATSSLIVLIALDDRDPGEAEDVLRVSNPTCHLQ